jgi:hypothetical protein
LETRLATDKDKDGFYVGSEVPETLRDPNDNDRSIIPTAGTTSNPQNVGGGNGTVDFNEDVSGFIVRDKDGNPTYLNNTTALTKYLKSLSPTVIKQFKQQYKSAGLYDGPVNGLIGPADAIVNLIGNALNYQEIQGAKTTLSASVAAAIKDLKATGAGGSGASNAPQANVTSKEAALADIQDQFRTMFGESAPKEIINAYRDELKSLELSRTTKRTNVKGVEVGTYGVSELERKNLINKYLNQYAQVKIANAQTGDPIAKASLTKGAFGLTYTTLRQAYSDNGIPMDTKGLNFASMVTDSALNPDRLKANLNLVNLHAKTLFPALGDKIDSGYTVKQLLSPYLQTRAEILEEDADNIDLTKMVDIAKDPKGLMGLYDYQIALRNDPKWRFTKNAQDSLSQVAKGLAETFGLVG